MILLLKRACRLRHGDTHASGVHRSGLRGHEASPLKAGQPS